MRELGIERHTALAWTGPVSVELLDATLWTPYVGTVCRGWSSFDVLFFEELRLFVVRRQACHSVVLLVYAMGRCQSLTSPSLSNSHLGEEIVHVVMPRGVLASVNY